MNPMFAMQEHLKTGQRVKVFPVGGAVGELEIEFVSLALSIGCGGEVKYEPITEDGRQGYVLWLDTVGKVSGNTFPA